MTSKRPNTDTARPRLAQAAIDAERMRTISRSFRANNPTNPDCDLFDRAASALEGVHTRLLSLAAAGETDEDEPSSGEPAAGSRRGPPVVPTGSRIQMPDSHRRAAGETRSQVRGGSAGGHGQLPV